MSGLASPPARERRVHIVQGEQHVSSDPDTVLSTLLGSCVAACLRDPVAAVGGMNHFLLPGDLKKDVALEGPALRSGVHAMELLVNELLRRGAQRSRLEAKLFGGARMMRGLTDVGMMNATFAERFLREEGVPVVGGSLRGERGRRIQFWPVSGRARQIEMPAHADAVFRSEHAPAPKVSASQGAVELF